MPDDASEEDEDEDELIDTTPHAGGSSPTLH
jgi:hypothetical protein